VGHFEVAHSLIEAMLRGEFGDWPAKRPNRRFSPPSLGNITSPAKFYAYDVMYDDAEAGNMGSSDQRNRRLEGRLAFIAGVQEDAGRSAVDAFYGRLDALSDAASTSNFTFFAAIPDDPIPSLEGEFKGFYLVPGVLPFRRTSALDLEDYVTVAGVGSTSRVITQATHGLAVGDWIGLDGSTWRRVRAVNGGEPRCDGVVSEVLTADAFVFTAAGIVTIPSNGWDSGALYLSQTTAGAGISTEPTSGIVQLLATVDGDLVVVHPQAAQELGGGG